MAHRSVRLHAVIAALVVGGLSRGAGAQAVVEDPGSVALRDSVVAMVRSHVGTRYVLGGNDPDGGFDCSGLVRYVLGALRLNTPRTARQQATLGDGVVKDPKALRPGDLLTFSNGKGVISHIGIYVGDGRYVHASSVAGRVVESQLNFRATPFRTVWQGARRLLALVDPREDGNWKLAAARPAAPRAATKRTPSLVVVPPRGASLVASLTAPRPRLTPKAAFRTVAFGAGDFHPATPGLRSAESRARSTSLQ